MTPLLFPRALARRASGARGQAAAGERPGWGGKRHALETEWMHGVDDGSSVRGFPRRKRHRGLLR